MTATADIQTDPTLAQTLTLTCAVNDLRDALSWVSWSLPTTRRAARGALLGIRLSTARGVLTVSATDYETTATAEVSTPGAGTGSALVPGALLGSIIRALPKGSGVTLAASAGVLHVTGGDEGGALTYRVPLMDPEAYPLPATPGAHALTLSGLDLAQLARSAMAAGRDCTLPILTAVHFDIRADGITAAATDRYRLAVAELPGQHTETDELLIPAQVLARAAAAMRKDRAVTLSWSRDAMEGYVTFSSGARTLTTRLQIGEYPKYRSLLPTIDSEHPTIRADRGALLTALSAVEPVIYRHGPVHIDIRPGEPPTLASHAPGHVLSGSDATARAEVPGLTCTGFTEPSVRAFNPAYFRDGLGALTGPDVVIRQAAPTKPALISNDDDPGFTYLLMPVRLSG